MSSKTPSQSKATLTEIVLPNDTNNLNNLMGGRLLHWMDIAAAITAHRHCNRTCVTASVNNVSFEHPIPRGSIVTLEANISRSFSSSMEIFIDVWIEDELSGSKTKDESTSLLVHRLYLHFSLFQEHQIVRMLLQ